jgi:superfamily I DNA and/or RNA helicase
MHEDIQSLSNIIGENYFCFSSLNVHLKILSITARCPPLTSTAYNGLLKCGNDKVKRSILQLKHFPLTQSHLIDNSDRCWLDHSISPSKPVVFIDTDGLGNGLEAIGPVNRVESVITAKLALALSAAGLDESSIGIITPFRSQVSLLLRNGLMQILDS